MPTLLIRFDDPLRALSKLGYEVAANPALRTDGREPVNLPRKREIARGRREQSSALRAFPKTSWLVFFSPTHQCAQ